MSSGEITFRLAKRFTVCIYSKSRRVARLNWIQQFMAEIKTCDPDTPLILSCPPPQWRIKNSLVIAFQLQSLLGHMTHDYRGYLR